MPARSRIVSVSMDEDLLAHFDGWLAARGLPSRSLGVQRLVREKLDALALSDERGPAVATVTFVYDHHRRDLMERLAHIQHEHLSEVIAATHVHLDHDHCLEVLVLRGPARVVRALGDRILAVRGVERGEMFITSARPRTAGHAHAHAGPAWHAAAHAHGGRDHERTAPEEPPPGEFAASERKGRAARRKRG